MSVFLESTWVRRAVQYLSIDLLVLGLKAVSLAAAVPPAGGGVREAIFSALEKGFLSRMVRTARTWCLRDLAVLGLMIPVAGLPMVICLLAAAGGGVSDSIFSALDSVLVVLVALIPRTCRLQDLTVLGLMDGDLTGARRATRSALVGVAVREVRWRRRLRTWLWQD